MSGSTESPGVRWLEFREPKFTGSAEENFFALGLLPGNPRGDELVRRACGSPVGLGFGRNSVPEMKGSLGWIDDVHAGSLRVLTAAARGLGRR